MRISIEVRRRIHRTTSGRSTNPIPYYKIGQIARQWNEIGDEEKAAWQYKAEQLKQANAEAAELPAESSEALEEVAGLPESSEDWSSKKRESRKAPPKTLTADV